MVWKGKKKMKIRRQRKNAIRATRKGKNKKTRVVGVMRGEDEQTK